MESTIEHDNREKKQKYLKEQIMENSELNAEEFTKFMSEAKPKKNGENIDNWTLEELVSKVEEFKTLKMQNKSKLILTSRSSPKQNV